MKREDITKMAQAWNSVQEASYGKKKMEAMDPVNPKELKGKHKDRKDKDINNDGKVDSTDKYLHARRKAVSAAIKGKKKDQEVEVQTSESTDQLGEGINIGKLHDLHAYHEKKAEAHAAAQKKHDSNSKMADHHSEQGYEHENAADHLHNASKAYDKGDHKAVAKHLDMYHKTPVARQGIKEAAKQIDEISKKTLGLYINKAHKDYDKQRTKQGAAYDKAARTGSDDDEDKGHEYGRKADKRTQGIKTAVSKLTREAKDHGNMNNGSPAGEGLSPSAKKELARKTPMPDFVNEPKIDKKTFDAIRASGKKAKARNNDNTSGDKNIINKSVDITAKASRKEDDGFKDS